MKLGKKELIISIVMLIVFLILGLNLSVFATNNNSISFNNGFSFNLVNNNNNIIPTNNSATNNVENNQEIPQNNTTQIPQNNTTQIPQNNTNNTSNTDVPNTGLEDAPWLIIAVCGVSAIFAYKKIKEYNQI